MDSATYLGHLAKEVRAFHACLGDDLTLPVEHCGDWTLYDLADHLGRGHLWVVAAVTERRKDYLAPPAPRDPQAMRTWFDQTCTVLLSVLAAAPDTEAWTFYPPHTVGFWRRRMCQEAIVHRWDAEHALGRTPVLDPVLAADGVSEVFDTMVPRQEKRGRMAPLSAAVSFVAPDVGETWTYGPGDPVAEATAPAADLLMLLWQRLPADHPSISWQGDRAAAAAWLANPLVP